MEQLLPVDVVNQLLPNFGITSPSSLYERRVRDNGFKFDDILELIEESPFVYTIDWRACLNDELEVISSSLSKLGVELSFELNEDGNCGRVWVDDMVSPISYSPDVDNGSFDSAMFVLQSVLPERFEIRASVYNGGNDSNCYAILPEDYWQEVDSLAGEVVNRFFVPFNHNKAR